ncbi:repeat domain (rpt), partial [human gut metagenome]
MVLNDLGSVGAALEIGAYADLYGYLHYHSQDMRHNKYYASPKEHYHELQGGIYFEMGVYIKISIFAESKLFKKKAELAKQFKFPLFSVGDKY